MIVIGGYGGVVSAIRKQMIVDTARHQALAEALTPLLHGRRRGDLK